MKVDLSMMGERCLTVLLNEIPRRSKMSDEWWSNGVVLLYKVMLKVAVIIVVLSYLVIQ